jgi:hypothetical protein
MAPSAAFALLLWGLAMPNSAGATVAEQRARLPPAAECTDEVAGVWRSHSFWPDRGQWYLFTLEIRRLQPESSELEGVIFSDYWHGTSRDQEPPPCGQVLYHYIVRMPAKGSVNGGAVAFGGTSWQLDRAPCGGSGPGRYYPDRFTGTIDPKLQEFQSVNNDGGPAVNVPMVFRRIRCWDGAEPEPPPAINVKAPALGPKSKSKKGGCSCTLVGTLRPARRGPLGLVGLVLAVAGGRRIGRGRRERRAIP